MKRIEAKHLVFLDESGIRVGMKRLYGRSAKGWRIVDYASGGHWQTHTMTAAIRANGVAAAMVTRKAINSITFLGFIEQFLCPTLSPGDLVVMDNLAVHKVKGVDDALRAVGARSLYLPPYSPDLNPIELAWAKVKALLRAKPATSSRKLIQAVGNALKNITEDDCTNFMRHDGYDI